MLGAYLHFKREDITIPANSTSDEIGVTYLGAYMVYRYNANIYTISIPYFGAFTKQEENGLIFKRTSNGAGARIENPTNEQIVIRTFILSFE